MPTHHPFVIRILEQEEDTYLVVGEFQGVSRSATVPARMLGLDGWQIDEAKTWLARAFVDRDYAKDFGTRLFQISFPPPILELFRLAEQRIPPGDGLRVVLDFPVPDALADLPWELMYDEEGGHGFLARSTTAPLVRRYTDVPFPNDPPKEGPLRVLVVVAQPQNMPLLSSEQEIDEIVRALEKGPGLRDRLRVLGRHLQNPRSLSDLVRQLRQGNRFEVSPPLYHATRSRLQERVAGEDFHVVHFIGHGLADPDGGILLLEPEDPHDDEADRLQADEFAELVGESRVSLVVLNACETASTSNLFQSLAHKLLRRGVPAVIGMQMPILDLAAVDFSRAFYRAWAAGEPIETALAYARRLIRHQSPGAAYEWSIPVLYSALTGGLTLQPLKRPPGRRWPLRFGRWAWVTFFGLLAVITALLQIPDTVRRIRTEVPLINCVAPYPMDESKFTVVFNAFTVADEKGSLVFWSDDGRDLADFLYERFAISFEELDLPIPYELRPPTHTCAIRGRTSEERAARAQDLAERINADVIVYGVISDTVDDPQFSLEFNVSHQGFEEGEEIAGPYALGGPLPIELPFEPADLMFIEYPPHLVRTDVLSLISIGLAYYSLDNFEKALEYFQQAEQHEHWPRTDGKEIVHLLLGNAKVRQLFQQPSRELVSSANDDYQQALDIKPDYARAKLGLADAIYLQALGDPEKPTLQTVDWNLLEESAATYGEALALGNAQGNDTIEPKVHWGLGRIYLLYGLRGDNDMLEQAKREFQWIIDEYEGGNTRIANRAGHAHAYLGVINQRRDLASAIKEYERAVELVTPFYQAFYASRLGELHCQAGEVVLAMEAYQDAVDQARLYGYRKRVEEYTDKLNELRSTGCP